MNWTPYLLLTLLATAGCQSSHFPKPIRFPEPEWLMKPTQITFSGGKGTSSADAVVILGAIGTKAGIDAEHEWLFNNNISYSEILQQSLIEENGRRFDVVEYHGVTQQIERVWFDISEFYGKSMAGKWMFIGTDGEKLAADIDDLDTPIWDSRPWESAIGSKCGSLTYQTTWFLGTGPLVNGKFHGTWRIFGYDGAQDQRGYKDGKDDGFWYAWYPNGKPWIQHRWDTNTQWSSFYGWNVDGKKYRVKQP